MSEVRSDLDPLTEHLLASERARVVLSFIEMERLGCVLNESMRRHRAVWSNSDQNIYSRYWLDAGYKTTTRDLAPDQVGFDRFRTVAAGDVQRRRDRSESNQGPSPSSDTDVISEDEVKKAVRDWLAGKGFTVDVRWGREPGIDIEAHRGPDHLVIEAKGQVARNAQNHNYFLGALGELVQRMTAPETVYGLALPDIPQYRGLVDRLPSYARERLGLAVFFVSRTGDGFDVAIDPPGVIADG